MVSQSIIRLARSEIKGLQPCIHGGEIWKYYPQHGNILDFSSNTNPLGPPSKAIEAVKRNLWKIPFYPDSDSISLREAISNYIGNVGTENIIVGNGSTEVIYLFCEVFIRSGDEAIIPIPTFGEYENTVKKAGGIPKYLKLDSSFRIEPEKLLREVRPKTKAIFLCNPNNPTGSLISNDELSKIIENVEAIVFVDEDFIEFVDEEVSLISRIKTYKNLFVLRSFTKFFGLTGLRVGYGVSNEEIIKLLFRGKLPWNVNCLAQVAAIAALQDAEYMEKTRRLIREERKFLLENLSKIRGLKVFPSHANFILIDVRETGFTSIQLKDEMLKRGILIRDCSSFKGLDEYYIRIAVRTRYENERLLTALRNIINSS